MWKGTLLTTVEPRGVAQEVAVGDGDVGSDPMPESGGALRIDLDPFEVTAQRAQRSGQGAVARAPFDEGAA